ncbi:carbamate kinase [Fusobacterium naviforme]|nr:carbamate kinase [Fusobacterium naviforme]PSL11530.1 carbamate kinase [Fusobacterium naviforme]STO26611.1 Carbamate kinase 1 [Fusobacterium naviforme]
MAKKRLVLSLGHKDLGTNLPEQKAAIGKTAPIIADFIQEGWQVALTHSNVPQVGMIHGGMSEFALSHPDEYTSVPLAVCSAMSQGYIGYDLQNGLRSELLSRGIYKTVSTIITQVTVNPYDEAFYDPLKTIGRCMSADEAAVEDAKGNQTVEVPGKGYQRIVPAPNPVAIVEIDAIKALLDADQLVICCGGGGVPVMEQGTALRGASAVIEKDLTSGLLAREIDADVLMIVTAVDNVTLNFGTPAEEPISEMSIEAAKQYMAAGHFEFKSMLPKIRAAVDFVESGRNRTAIITSLAKAQAALKGRAGTRIA